MKIIGNEALYKRNIRNGFIASMGGIFLLIAAVYTLFTSQNYLGRYFLFLFGGVILMQIGLYYSRWSRRPDWSLNKVLKSLDNSYSIYHHNSPVSHLLLGPAGLWILMPKFTKGRVRYDKDKQTWRAEGVSLWKRFTRGFAQEGIGRPHLEAMYEAAALDRYLQKHWEADKPLHVQAAVVFLEEGVEVQAGDAPLPAVQLKKLKQTVTGGDAKGKLSRQQIDQLTKILAK
jgi:hypothetical protein